MPAITGLAPTVWTLKLARTPVLSATLLISSAKAPIPVPTEVEILILGNLKSSKPL